MMSSTQEFIEACLKTNSTEIRSRVISRGDFLIQPGQPAQDMYLVESGAVRVMYVTEADEQTIRFGYAGSIIAALPSLFDGSSSLFYIEALRKTTVQCLSKSLFDSILDSHAELRTGYTKLLEELIGSMIEREIDLMTPSPVERYKRLLKRSPQVFQEIPGKYIAAYLRMTPETLSRLRNS